LDSKYMNHQYETQRFVSGSGQFSQKIFEKQACRYVPSMEQLP